MEGREPTYVLTAGGEERVKEVEAEMAPSPGASLRPSLRDNTHLGSLKRRCCRRPPLVEEATSEDNKNMNTDETTRDY